MKTVVLLGITLLAGVGVIALTMPGPYAFADLRNLTRPAAWKAPAQNQIAAAPTGTQSAALGIPAPVQVTRLVKVEQATHEEAARRQALVDDQLRDQDQASKTADFARELHRTRVFARLATADDVKHAAFDTKYFKGSEFAGCVRVCEAATPCLAPTSLPRSPRSAAALRRMEVERKTLEQIREIIEDEHSYGRLPLGHYKRLMTRCNCGIRTYQAQITSGLSIADAG